MRPINELVIRGPTSELATFIRQLETPSDENYQLRSAVGNLRL
jgi:hypothetical protein